MNKVSRRVVHDMSRRCRNTKFSNDHFLREGPIYQSDYFLMLRPVLCFGFICGRMPFMVRSGWMRYSYKSLPFTYAIVLALANWICHAYYMKDIVNAMDQMLESSISFNNVLFTFLIFIQPFTTAVMAYSWVFEIPVMVECFNRTAVLEKNLSTIFLTKSRTTWTRRSVALSITFFFVSDFVIAWILLVSRYGDEYPPLVILLIIMNTVVNYSHSILWCFNFYFIRDFAVKLHKHMLSCLQVKENTPFKLYICRRVWIKIWKQSQSYSHSIAVSIGYALLVNGTIFVIGCYGTIVSIGDADILQIIEMSPYIGISLLVIACVIEMPHQATDKLGNAFLNSMVIVKSYEIDQRCIEEIDKFLYTIKQSRNAIITLKDYMTMDRSLLMSFLSYSATYLIVLLQLQNKGNGNVVSHPSDPIRNNTEIE